MIEQAPPAVTWIKVDKPTLDIVGLVLRSFGATIVLAIAALGLGVLLGLNLIRRRHRARQAARDHLTHLNLADPRPPRSADPDGDA
jgi:hypothetical protein